ncbi:hypothetical protein SAMN05444401_4071 [Clostridium amylolyticum]|uniref:Uncharacterized protein n=1 Tax=Clostridium amylolyticum TaxID=1121298 RepID=A0A1M6MQE5_9CLOT|nr:hypothetical protein [Clostridium amylolyticum]SHJ85629.1 hypothetical protein SAMN05444401_4071 [Clostridium amylolyticum]
MSQCPFWSNKKEKVNCFEDCVFYSREDGDSCPFKIYLESSKMNIKDIIDFNVDDEEGFAFAPNW